MATEGERKGALRDSATVHGRAATGSHLRATRPHPWPLALSVIPIRNSGVCPLRQYLNGSWPGPRYHPTLPLSSCGEENPINGSFNVPYRKENTEIQPVTIRSEERRVGIEWMSTCRTRGST